MTEWKRGEKKRLIREMYVEGHSIEEIADKLGYKENSVKTILPKLGIYRKRADSLGMHTEEMLEMREQGKTLAEIGEKIGYSPCRICSHLTELGYKKNRFFDDYAEEELTDESTEYAKPRIEKREVFIIDGKRYVTVPLSEICGG